MLNTTRVAVATLSIIFLSVTAAQAQSDHLQCHKVKDGQKFKFADVTLTAIQPAFQMPDGCTIKGKAKKFCVPVEKAVSETDAPGSLIGAGPDLSAADYLCYKMKCPKTTIADTLVTDQFGERDLLKIKTAQEICVPAVKGVVTTTMLTQIFETSPAVVGALGDRATTSALCAAEAVTQGLSCSSTVALLSYSGGDDIASMPTNHGVPANTGVVVAGSGVSLGTDWFDLLDGSWDSCLGSVCYPSGSTPGGLLGTTWVTATDNAGALDGVLGNCADFTSMTGGYTSPRYFCRGVADDVTCTAGGTWGATLCANLAFCCMNLEPVLCACY